MVNELVVFAGIIALASVSPGPNTILVIDHSLAFGLRRVAPTILGNIAFLFLVALAAALGVGAILKSMPLAYDALRLVGASYLVFLGAKALRSAWRGGGAIAGAKPPVVAGAGRRFVQAFLVSATNLQSVFFLAALFPNFLHHDQPLAGQFATLFSVLILVVGTVHSGYAAAAALVRSRIGERRLRHAFQYISGITLLGFGATIFAGVFRRP